MKKFGNFLNEDAEPKELVKMIFSDDFKKTLTNILEVRQSNISKRLLELPKSDQKFDISYVDIDEEKDSVTYLTINRIERLKKEGALPDEYWKTKLRDTTKIGRFVKKIFGSKFNEKSVNAFADKFKTMSGSDQNLHKFEIVDGDDLIYWYNRNNYSEKIGTLGADVMSYNASSIYLNMYSKNPKKCKLLILKSDTNDKRIIGRALLWKLTTPSDKIFMDRVYSTKSSHVDLFINYAKREGWLYKGEQVYGDSPIVNDGVDRNIKMHVEIDNTDFKYYPFVDTLRYYYPNLKILANHKELDDIIYTLNDENGKYQEYEWDSEKGFKKDPTVFDSNASKDINFRDAMWCEVDNAYCGKRDAVFLSYKNVYALPKSDKIVYSEYQKRYYLKEDCVWSEPLKSWIWNKYAVDVYHDKDRTTDPDKVHRFEVNRSIKKVGDYWYDIDLDI